MAKLKSTTHPPYDKKSQHLWNERHAFETLYTLLHFSQGHHKAPPAAPEEIEALHQYKRTVLAHTAAFVAQAQRNANSQPTQSHHLQHYKNAILQAKSKNNRNMTILASLHNLSQDDQYHLVIAIKTHCLSISEQKTPPLKIAQAHKKPAVIVD